MSLPLPVRSSLKLTCLLSVWAQAVSGQTFQNVFTIDGEWPAYPVSTPTVSGGIVSIAKDLFVRMAPSGIVIAEVKTIGMQCNELLVLDVTELQNGDICVLNWSYDCEEFTLSRFTGLGSLVWSVRLVVPGADLHDWNRYSWIWETSSENLLVCPPVVDPIHVLALSSSGTLLWSKAFGSSPTALHTMASSAIMTSDSVLTIVGLTTESLMADVHPYVIHVNENGDVVSSALYLGMTNTNWRHVGSMESDLFLSGYSMSYGHIIARMSDGGTILWARQYPTWVDDIAVADSDNYVLMSEEGWTFMNGNGDITGPRLGYSWLASGVSESQLLDITGSEITFAQGPILVRVPQDSLPPCSGTSEPVVSTAIPSWTGISGVPALIEFTDSSSVIDLVLNQYPDTALTLEDLCAFGLGLAPVRDDAMTKIFPSVVNSGDLVTVCVSRNTYSEMAVIDMQGRILRSQELTDDERSFLDTSTMRSGVYVVLLISGETGTRWQTRLVVR